MFRLRYFLLPAMVGIFGLAACGGRPATFVPPAMQYQSVESAGTSPANVYVLGDGGVNTQYLSDMRVGADGQLYYSTSPNIQQSPIPTSGEIGSFNFSTHTQQYQTVGYWPGFIQMTTSAVWVEEANNASKKPTIDKYTAIGGTDTAIAIPIKKGQGIIGDGIYGGIAVGADGQLWWGTQNLPDVGEIDQSTNAVSVYPLPSPDAGISASPQFMTLGSDSYIWVTDAANDGVYRVVSDGSGNGSSTFTQMPQGSSSNASIEGIAAGPGGSLYTGLTFYLKEGEGAFDNGQASSTPNFSSVALPAVGIEPFAVAAGTTNVYFDDVHYSGLGIYNTATGKMVILPLTTPAVGGVAVDSTGTPWVGCKYKKASCVESVALTSTWKVYPSQSIKLYTEDKYGNMLPPGLIGIGESGNSGPFFVKSSNTAYCTASMISGFAHNIQVNPVATGTCSLTITDAHKRSVKVAVTVLSGKGAPQTRVRGNARYLF